MNEFESEESASYSDGFRDGKAEGIRVSIDALSRECANAVAAKDMERSKKFADAWHCLLELFPDHKR